MVNPDLVQALAETGQGIKKLVNAVGEEMKSRTEKEERREERHQRFYETGEETFRLLVCTHDVRHYFAPVPSNEGRVLRPFPTPGQACPYCQRGTLREVTVRIIEP